MMQGFFNWLLNQFFPIKCIICGKEGHTVCDRCIVGCKFSPKWLGFERFKVWTAFSYKNKVAQQIVQNWKYSGNKKIINNLLDLIDYPKFQDLDYLVPVPLHRRRKVERGFNQASQMAQLMSSQLNIEYIDCLKRTKYTKPQAQLDKSERRNNLKNCIELSDQIVKGKRIAIIDDVVTTGSTLLECNSILVKAGAGKTIGICLLRGKRD